MFSQKLKGLRKEKNVTQVELARIVGVERSTIGKYESTNIIPSVDVLQSMSDYFGVSIDYLLSKEDNPNQTSGLTSRDEKDIAKRIEALSQDLTSQETLMLSGEILDEETRELLKSALDTAVRISKRAAKEKFNPMKNKNKEAPPMKK